MYCTSENLQNQVIQFNGLCDGTLDVTQNFVQEDRVNKSITIPSSKPLSRIDQIQSIDSKLDVIKIKVVAGPGETTAASVQNNELKKLTGRKIIVSSVACLNIVFNDAASQAQMFSVKIPFYSYIVIDKTIGGQDPVSIAQNFDVKGCIENLNINSIENGILNLSVSIILSALKKDQAVVIPPSTCACTVNDAMTITGVCPEDKLKAFIAQGERNWNTNTTSISVTIPMGLPDIDTIISSSSTLKILGQKVISTPNANGNNQAGLTMSSKELAIDGVIKQRINYQAANQEQTMTTLIIDIPISVYIVLPQATMLTAEFIVISCIEDIQCCLVNPKEIYFSAITVFNAKVKNPAVIVCSNINKQCCEFDYTIKGVCDLTSIGALAQGNSWIQLAVPSTTILKTIAPNVLFIYSISSNATIDSTSLIETVRPNQASKEGITLTGKEVIIKGTVEHNVVYVADNTLNTLNAVNYKVPFVTSIMLAQNTDIVADTFTITNCIENIFCANVGKTIISNVVLFLQAKKNP